MHVASWGYRVPPTCHMSLPERLLLSRAGNQPISEGTRRFRANPAFAPCRMRGSTVRVDPWPTASLAARLTATDRVCSHHATEYGVGDCDQNAGRIRTRRMRDPHYDGGTRTRGAGTRIVHLFIPSPSSPKVCYLRTCMPFLFEILQEGKTTCNNIMAHQ